VERAVVKALKWKANSSAEGRPLRQIADVLTGAVPLEKAVRGKIVHTLAILAAEQQPGGSGNRREDEGVGHGSEEERAPVGEGHCQGMAREVSSE
jgi:hypothetical protein